MSRNVSEQNEVIQRRSKFKYSPDRHYVKVQKSDDKWDEDTYEQFMDMVGPDGEPVYRIEADGAESSEARSVTGSRRMVVLSCSKEFAESRQKSSSNQSQEYAFAEGTPSSTLAASDQWEKLERPGAISLNDIPNK